MAGPIQEGLRDPTALGLGCQELWEVVYFSSWKSFSKIAPCKDHYPERVFFTWQILCISCQHTQTCPQETLEEVPLRFSLCFGLDSTCKAALQPFCSLRKREASVWLMLSGSVVWGPDSYRDWNLHTDTWFIFTQRSKASNTAMFKKSEAELCLVFPRLSYVLNGRTVRLRPMGSRRWRCYSPGLSTLHLHLRLCCPPPRQPHGTHSCISVASVPTWCPGLNCWTKRDWIKLKSGHLCCHRVLTCQLC